MKQLTPQEVLRAIADGKNLEFKEPDSTSWRSFTLDNPIFIKSVFDGYFIFRLAQEMITINGVSFPKPVSEPLEHATEYWTADPCLTAFVSTYPNKWSDDEYDNTVLSRGILHLTRENAIAHAKALIKLSGGNVDE